MKKVLFLVSLALTLAATNAFSQAAGTLKVNKVFACPVYIQLVGGPSPCSSMLSSIVFTQLSATAVYNPVMAGWPPSYFISGVRVYYYDPGICGSLGFITYGTCTGMVLTASSFASSSGTCSGFCVQYFGNWVPESMFGGTATLNCTI